MAQTLVAIVNDAKSAPADRIAQIDEEPEARVATRCRAQGARCLSSRIERRALRPSRRNTDHPTSEIENPTVHGAAKADLMRLVPIVRGARVDCERHRQGERRHGRLLHYFLYHGKRALDFAVGDLEHQLAMHLT